MSADTITVVFQIIGVMLKWYGAKQATLEAFEKLVEASKDDGLISVQTKNVFTAQKAELLKSKPPSA